MRTLLGWAVCGFVACSPATPLSCTPAQSAPFTTGPLPDGACESFDEITTDRMIRAPDGMPLVIHCDGGTPP